MRFLAFIKVWLSFNETLMEILWEAIVAELSFETPDVHQMVRISVRLLFAVGLAAIIGWERETANRSAGLRTHMLVALGSALFTVSSLEASGNEASDVTRVIQGVATGVGFIGGGAILKLESENRITGLTTAGTVWLAAAIGVVAGLGKLGAAVVGILMAWIILVVLERFKWKALPEEEKETNHQVSEV